MKIKLKEIRSKRGFSQNELARKLEMSLANVQKIEYSKAKSIPLDTLDKLCAVLECQPGDLLEYVPGGEVGDSMTQSSDRLDRLEALKTPSNGGNS